MSLTLQTPVRRRPEVLTNPVGEEIVMLDIEQGNYYGLDPIASRIWKLLEEPITLQEVCEQLIAEFEVTPEMCAHDVLTFAKSLQQHGLLDPVTPA